MEGAQQLGRSPFSSQNCECGQGLQRHSRFWLKAADLDARSGRKVITTCSPKHFALMKELGADEVYDYVRPKPPPSRTPNLFNLC